jgi:ubiquinone/menaquinone biosynthesis C-methylase UbiE
MNKHYNSEYLNATNKVLQQLKESSYTIFKKINKGLIVDLGCGNGADVYRLSKLLPKDVKVIGLDNDANMIHIAQQMNESSKNGNTAFMLAEAIKLPFHDSSIDGLRTERLIQHLLEPEKVIGEIHRALKKNSPLVILETDWQSMSFYNEHISIQKKITKYLTQEKVNNGFAAKKLITSLLNQGFRNLEFKVFPLVSTSLKEVNKYLKFEIILEELRAKEYINEKEFALFKTTLREHDRVNCFSCSINMIGISAIK